MDMGFAKVRPLARHAAPLIRFLFIDPRLCLALLSDAASRQRPWVRLSFTSIRLDRDFHPEPSNMLGTRTRRHGQDARATEYTAARARRPYDPTHGLNFSRLAMKMRASGKVDREFRMSWLVAKIKMLERQVAKTPS